MTTTQGVILIILSSVLILSSAESLYSRACAGGDAPAACKKFCELCQTGCIPPGKTLATKTFMDVCDEEQQLKFDQEQKENTKICQEFMDGLTNGAASDAEKSKNTNTKVGHNGHNSGLLDVWANADSMTVHTAILCVSIAAALWQLSGIHKKQAETLEEIGKLQVGKKNSLEDEKNVLDGQKKALEDEKKAFGREKKALEDEKNALDGQKKALEEDKTALETKKSALKEKKKAFEEEKKAFESEKTKLEEEKKELEREKMALDTKKKALESEKTKLEEEKKALEDKNNNALKETSKDQKDVSEGHENAGKDQDLSNAPEDTAGKEKKNKKGVTKPSTRNGK